MILFGLKMSLEKIKTINEKDLELMMCHKPQTKEFVHFLVFRKIEGKKESKKRKKRNFTLLAPFFGESMTLLGTCSFLCLGSICSERETRRGKEREEYIRRKKNRVE